MRRADEHLISAEQGRWFARLHADTDNLRAVLAWCSGHDLAGAIDLATTLFDPWRMHGQLQELASWLERVLATPGSTDPRTRAVGLRTYGEALLFTNEPERAHDALEESLNLSRTIGDRQAEAYALMRLAGARWGQGFVEEAIDLQEAALAIFREVGHLFGIEVSLHNLGTFLRNTGDLEHSRTMFEEAIAICTELGDHEGVANNVAGLADIALDRRDPQRAACRYRQVLELVSDLGDERVEVSNVAGLACVAVLQGDVLSAGRLWGVVEAAEKRLGTRLVAADRVQYERIVTPLHDHQDFEAGYEAGRDIELAEAVRELRQS